MSLLSKIAAGFERFYQILRVFAIVGGGWWAVHEYLDRKENLQVEQTLKFTERFEQFPVWGAREKIDRAWLTEEPEILRILVQEKNVAAWPGFVNQLVVEHALQLDVFTMIDFFEALGICIQQKICHAESARKFFSRKVILFFNQHMHYIYATRERLNDDSIGAGLEALAEEYKQ